MKYEIQVNDPKEYINYIVETKNDDGCLILDVDYKIKRLTCLEVSNSNGSFGICFFRESDEPGVFGEILVHPEQDGCRKFMESSRYGATLIVVTDKSDNKSVYEGKHVIS